MRIVQEQDTLKVTDIELLDSAHAPDFKSAVEAALASRIRLLDVDLSHTSCLDCAGLGALLALRKHAQANNSNALLRLRNPPQSAQRLLRLTHADEMFSLVS